MNTSDNNQPGRCACCGKVREAGDAYPQPDGRTFCGNCDGGEQPGCPNCAPPAFFGILAAPPAQR